MSKATEAEFEAKVRAWLAKPPTRGLFARAVRRALERWLRKREQGATGER